MAAASRAFGSARLHVAPCSWDVTWCTYILFTFTFTFTYPGNLLGPLMIPGDLDFSGWPAHLLHATVCRPVHVMAAHPVKSPCAGSGCHATRRMCTVVRVSTSATLSNGACCDITTSGLRVLYPGDASQPRVQTNERGICTVAVVGTGTGGTGALQLQPRPMLAMASASHRIRKSFPGQGKMLLHRNDVKRESMNVSS